MPAIDDRTRGEGPSLTGQLWFLQGLEEEMVATIALDVLKGLDYMHSHSMLHRDVKVPHLPTSPHVPAHVQSMYCPSHGSCFCNQ